jgi:hypothetical protein
MNTKIVDITPDTSLFPKLGFAGYNAPQALAELVDNAIDEKLTGKPLTISIKVSKENIVVADNAMGMDETGVIEAMTLARSRKRNKLGEFGLGLKTACLSLGEVFELRTSRCDTDKEYRVSFDEAEWNRLRRGWNLPLHEYDAQADDHYTVVTVARLKTFYPGMANYIRADFQKRFAPFIANDDVKILVNKTPCASERPELVDGSRQEFNIALRSGHSVHGWSGLLKQGSNKGLYGFTTYRRGRMITAFDKIAIGIHPTISRIVGEIHMDHVSVTTAKREFEKESREYIEAEAALKEEFKGVIRLARQKAGEEKVTKDVTSRLDLWLDRIAEAINSEEFHNYTVRIKGTVLRRDDSASESGEVEVEKRRKPSQPAASQQESKTLRTRTPQKTHKRRRHVVRLKGKNVRFEHQFAALGQEASWKNWKYDPGKLIEIYTNTEFPAFHASKDKAFYAVMTIAESISEVLVQQAEEDAANIDEVKELILRKTATLMLEL